MTPWDWGALALFFVCWLGYGLLLRLLAGKGHVLNDDMLSVRQSIARMAIALETARAVVYRAADRLDRDHEGAAKAVAVAKFHAPNVANDVADAAVQIFGGLGFLEEGGVSRHYRDARVLRIGGGTDEVQFHILSKLS